MEDLIFLPHPHSLSLSRIVLIFITKQEVFESVVKLAFLEFVEDLSWIVYKL